MTSSDSAPMHGVRTVEASVTWTEGDRLAKEFAEHDVAFAIVNGFLPRPDDVEKLRALYSKQAGCLEKERERALGPTFRITANFNAMYRVVERAVDLVLRTTELYRRTARVSTV